MAPAQALSSFFARQRHDTVYLGRAADALRSRGEIIPEELLARVAPLGWEHVAFNGDDVWPAERLGNAFRPLRNPRAEFLDAAQGRIWNIFCDDPWQLVSGRT